MANEIPVTELTVPQLRKEYTFHTNRSIEIYERLKEIDPEILDTLDSEIDKYLES